MPSYGSLFSGVGGFDMGFDQAGYDCLFQVEWDKHCQQILARHWPDVPRWSDVQDVNGAELPPCDVLTFGSPCQDLSVAGKRAGIDGGRSSMFFEATRIIREMRDATGNTYPRVVVWENVPGALSSNRGADFQAVINEMADCGSLLTEWAVLDAQHFGVPQRRRRIFLVAVLDPATASRCPDPLLPVAPGRPGDYSKGKPKREDIANALSGGSDSRDSSPDIDQIGFGQSSFAQFSENKVAALKESGGDLGGGSETLVVGALTVSDLTRQVTNEIVFKNLLQVVEKPFITFTAQRVGEAPRVYEDSTPTLTAHMGTGGNNTPMVTEPAVRRLTPLECERLMGWPDNHTRYKPDGTEQADTHRYKQCGNGVATPVARWVARQIMQVLRG